MRPVGVLLASTVMALTLGMGIPAASASLDQISGRRNGISASPELVSACWEASRDRQNRFRGR